MSTDRGILVEASTSAVGLGPSGAGARAFLGWRMVGLSFLAMMLSHGVSIGAFSNFVLPLAESFSVARDTIALGMTIAIVTAGFLNPFVGRWVDRGHARLLMTGGSLLSAAGLILMSRVDDLRVFALLYGLSVCAGAALFGTMSAMTLTANWFARKRGFALGITFAGSTIAGAVVPVLAQYLIDAEGWRTALLYVGLFVLLVGVPLFGLLVVGRPEEVGQIPDGDPLSGSEPAVSDALTPIAQLARDPQLWLICFGFGLLVTSPFVLVTLLVPFGVGLGFTAQETNAFLVAAMPFSLFSKLVLGALADRASVKPIIALIALANVIVWLIFYGSPNYTLFVLTGAIYGLGIGAVAPVQGVVLGRCFGRANFGTVSGLGGIVMIGLLIMATLMSSFLQGENGEGYPTVFLVQAGLLLVGGSILAVIRIPSVDESKDVAG